MPTLVQLNFIVVLMLSACVNPQEKSTCASFQERIKSTYNFLPSQLNDKQREEKSAAMDKFWEEVKTNKVQSLPCLRQALADDKADPWFKFDGSNLLVSVDPSEDSKKIQIRNFGSANLDDVDLRVWVSTLAQRGYEGFDISNAAERWLNYPNARYFLPEHGAYEINASLGALILYGSMDEALATPALLRVINQPAHPGREIALEILLHENTLESLDALQRLDLSTLSSHARGLVEKEITRPDLFEPRQKPKTSRKQFLDAFQALLSGDSQPFFQLVSEVPDGERDVVATLTPDDLTLVRKVRRLMISRGNQHMIEYYDSFTRIIRTIIHNITKVR
jgi:hypothetical protein